jgi:5-(carboxyamino)imidazole ribonucleotide mutase
LPGVVASQTVLPVIGVPIATAMMGGIDSLLSIVQMPSGIPVATMAVGKSGALNAALFAVSLLGMHDPRYHRLLSDYRAGRAETLLEHSDPKV